MVFSEEIRDSCVSLIMSKEFMFDRLSPAYEAAEVAVHSLRQFVELVEFSRQGCDGRPTQPCDDRARLAVYRISDISIANSENPVGKLYGALAEIFRTDDSLIRWLSKTAIETCGPAWNASVMAVPCLSTRERAVVHLTACGMTNKEMAAELYVSTKTVEFHLANVYNKLQVNSRYELRKRLSELCWYAMSPRRH
ncbi:helix-turn-helix transcriptional regulator [Streptomyces sp. NPDC085932]|uniref:helix-turn-helix transcriptional regulator n=1 Tax=Streptomyces sp. NPDC085932 TaxID=3365741 RepID=UPI0037D27867